jgi:hypothetical protein
MVIIRQHVFVSIHLASVVFIVVLAFISSATFLFYLAMLTPSLVLTFLVLYSHIRYVHPQNIIYMSGSSLH